MTEPIYNSPHFPCLIFCNTFACSTNSYKTPATYKTLQDSSIVQLQLLLLYKAPAAHASTPQPNALLFSLYAMADVVETTAAVAAADADSVLDSDDNSSVDNETNLTATNVGAETAVTLTESTGTTETAETTGAGEVTNAAETVETVEDICQKMLADSRVFIKKERYLELLQDMGDDLTEKEKQKLKKSPQAKIMKKILHNNRTFKDLYALSGLVYIKLDNESYGGQYFPRLTTTKSNGVHAIGLFLAKNRLRVTRGDFQTHQNVEFQAMLKMDQFKDKDVVYYYSQRELLQHCFRKWGVDFSATLKPEVDDKLRLLGILLTMEEMREYIPDILNKRRGEKGWQSLDAATGRARAAWDRILRLFCNEKVVIVLPVKWNNDEFKARVNARANDPHFYDKHGNFNPNNKDRIKLPWDKTSLKSVLHDGQGDYEGMMKVYTMGTGGGSGAPEDFADWWNRDESWIMNYTPQQVKDLYLAIIFMWDKIHNFPFSPPCQKMPPDCIREDEGRIDGGSNPIPIASAPKSKGDSVLAHFMTEMTSQRKETTKQLINAMRGKEESVQETDSAERAAIVKRITEARETKVKFEEDLVLYRKRRNKTEQKYADNAEKKAKKLKPLDKDIGMCKSMIKGLKSTLVKYNEELNALNNDRASKRLRYGDKNGSDSISSSSDGSGSETDE